MLLLFSFFPIFDPNACCEQPPGVPHPPMYQYRPRVYISNTLCAKKWATDPNITWKSNMHPLPKNLTLKSLNQMKERERERNQRIPQSIQHINLNLPWMFSGRCPETQQLPRPSRRRESRRGRCNGGVCAAKVGAAGGDRR